jgi:Holliday junction resolvase RusA-like endonuclease
VASRLTPSEIKALLKAAGLAPADVGLPPNCRAGRTPKRRRSNTHAHRIADADMVVRPPGSILCAGTISGRAAPWKAPHVGRNGGTIPTPGSKRCEAWQQVVAMEARKHMGPVRPYGFPVDLDVAFYIQPAPQQPDRTNLLKAFEDGLQGVVFVNDRQVLGGHTNLWINADEPERVEFIVTVR